MHSERQRIEVVETILRAYGTVLFIGYTGAGQYVSYVPQDGCSSLVVEQTWMLSDANELVELTREVQEMHLTSQYGHWQALYVHWKWGVWERPLVKRNVLIPGKPAPMFFQVN